MKMNYYTKSNDIKIPDSFNEKMIEVRDAVCSSSLSNQERLSICAKILIKEYGFDQMARHLLSTPLGTLDIIVASTEATISKHILSSVMSHAENVLIIMHNPREYWSGNEYERMMYKFCALQEAGTFNFNIITITNRGSIAEWYCGKDLGKVGAELRRRFKMHKFNDNIELCEFAIPVLRNIELDDSFILIAQKFSGRIGSEYNLNVRHYIDGETDDLLKSRYPFIEKHFKVEYSPMGAWQACLLTFPTAWMPLFWHGQYNRNQYIFSVKDLKNLEQDSITGHFDKQDVYEKCCNDERLLPKVKLFNGVAEISYCYWTDWAGLICQKQCLHFDGKGRVRFEDDEELELRYKDKVREVLYHYDCGVCW